MSEENQTEVAPEVIKRAKDQGWVPLEEFRDDESKWVDASTFVKRGDEINPILRKHNKDLQKQLEAANAKATEAIEAAKEFKEFQKKNFEKEKSLLERQIEQLKAKKKVAYNEQDGDLVVEIEEAIDELKEEKANLKPPKETIVAPPAQVIDATLQKWLDKNTWFGQDEKLTRRVNGLGAALRGEQPNLTGQAFLDALDEEIQETFPDKFKREKPVNAVESSSTRPTRSGKKTYDDLPADAKAACNRYLKQGLFKTKEEYVAEYDWD